MLILWLCHSDRPFVADLLGQTYAAQFSPYFSTFFVEKARQKRASGFS
jgi:hypothetical protein